VRVLGAGVLGRTSTGAVPSNPPSVESMTGWCPVPDRNGKVSGQNGQSCFWFSNGWCVPAGVRVCPSLPRVCWALADTHGSCSAVGCDTCDGNSRGPIPNCGNDPTKPCPAQKTPTGTGRNKVGPGVACKGAQKSTAKPTMCDPRLRTVNTAATCGGDDDWYYYSPWRAPGAAPVFDSCGMAGGHKPPQGGFGGIYVNTSHAKLGDKGTKVLPKAPSGTTWTVRSQSQPTTLQLARSL
jgi:hypothetical protein